MKIEIALTAVVFLAVSSYLVFSPASLTEVVDTVRSMVGPEPVALAENVFYGVTDAVQYWTFHGRTTPGFWSPAALPASKPPLPATAASGAMFQPQNLSPLYPELAVPGEGVWIPIPTPFDAAKPLMYKTFLHPDPTRPYARVAIVAMDATRLRLHAVAGTREPASSARVPRPGLIPHSDWVSLVAAFNGGFLAIHGHYGMMVDGQMILPAQPNAGTIAIGRDGQIRIAPWSAISPTLQMVQSFRQVPPLLASRAQLNPALQNDQVRLWGSSVSGETAIWRSAMGISSDGHTLFYAVGDSLVVRRLGEALVAAGASDVAELDVNAWLERFIVYTPTNGEPTARALLDQMANDPRTYVAQPATRDFFYLTLAK